MTMSVTRSFAVESPALVRVSTIPSRSAHKPPCADGPDDWDLDTGNPDTWRAAMRVCESCPLFARCEQLVRTLTERGTGPRAMIWAGVAYDNTGKVVTDLDRHRVTPIDHKRPLRIIRTGSRPAPAEPVAAIPRRRIVLGRRLEPTGTGEH